MTLTGVSYIIRQNVDYLVHGSNYKKFVHHIVVDAKRTVFYGPEYQCVECINVPLNQATQVEHSVTNEDCESAISYEETDPESDDCLETEIIIKHDNSITLDDNL